MMADMILICGISGSGKTTISKRMEEKHNLIRIGIDDFYAKVNGDERDRRNKFEVWIEFFKAIHEAEINNRSCVVEISGLTRHQRMELKEWFPNFVHHMVFLEADRDLRMANNLSRQRQVPEWRMRAMEESVQNPNIEDEDVMFDTIAIIKNTNNRFEEPRMIKGEWPFEDRDYN